RAASLPRGALRMTRFHLRASLPRGLMLVKWATPLASVYCQTSARATAATSASAATLVAAPVSNRQRTALDVSKSAKCPQSGRARPPRRFSPVVSLQTPDLRYSAGELAQEGAELDTDYLVIGSGIAGLYFALRAAAHGRVC